MAKNESAIVQLLKAAKYDPNHVEAIKDIKNSRELVFYESVSFVVRCQSNVEAGYFESDHIFFFL